jgi:lipoate-protein ligase B
MWINPSLAEIEIRNLGRVAFVDAVSAQVNAHQACVSDPKAPEVIFICEHDPVVTAGQSISEKEAESLRAVIRDIPVIRCDRGGLFTAHNPGQIVIYPIIRVAERKIGARRFVEVLSASAVNLLRDLKISATYDNSTPGVWVGSKKIAAVGIRIARRVSLHGVALNFTNDLAIFERFVPCGLVGRGVTKVADLVPVEPAELTERAIQWAGMVKSTIQSITNSQIKTVS